MSTPSVSPNGALTMKKSIRPKREVSPLPANHEPQELPLRKKDIRSFFPWKQLEVGDWFFSPIPPRAKLLSKIPSSKDLHKEVGRARGPWNGIHKGIRTMKRKYPEREFIAISAEQDGKEGIKVWRTK